MGTIKKSEPGEKETHTPIQKGFFWKGKNFFEFFFPLSFKLRKNGLAVLQPEESWECEISNRNLSLGLWNNHKDGWKGRWKAVSGQRGPLSKWKLKRYLPVLTPRLYLSVSTPKLSGNSSSPHFGNKKFQVVKPVCSRWKRQQCHGGGDRNLGYVKARFRHEGKKSLSCPQTPSPQILTPQERLPGQNSLIWIHKLLASFQFALNRPKFTCWVSGQWLDS